MKNNSEISKVKLMNELIRLTFDKDIKNKKTINKEINKPENISLIHIKRIESNTVESKIISVNSATRSMVVNIAKSIEMVEHISKIINNSVIKLIESMKSVIDMYSLSYKQLQDRTKRTTENIVAKFKIYNDFIISYDNIKKVLYKKSFIEHKNVVNLFYRNNIFPPINYIIDKQITDFEEGFNMEAFIQSEDIISFYINRVREWKLKYQDEDIIELIDDIEFNLNHRRAKTLSLIMPTLMEALLNNSSIDLSKSNTKANGGRYATIKKFLKDKIFGPIEIKYLQNRFINENLYNSTERAKYFSRHIIHGDKLELANMKTAINMILIYDFIQEIIVLDKAKEKIA